MDECEKYVSEEKEKGLNFEAFVCLNQILLQKQKVQACWTILHKFGYDTSLSLTDAYVEAKYLEGFNT